jgi:hypothetical protein
MRYRHFLGVKWSQVQIIAALAALAVPRSPRLACAWRIQFRNASGWTFSGGQELTAVDRGDPVGQSATFLVDDERQRAHRNVGAVQGGAVDEQPVAGWGSG